MLTRAAFPVAIIYMHWHTTFSATKIIVPLSNPGQSVYYVISHTFLIQIVSHSWLIFG